MITLIPPGADGKVTLGVHDGHFHPDDVVCAALLFMAYGRERVRVVRSREAETLEKCLYVLDVGERDLVTADRVCLDHHQQDSLTRPNGVKASAAGKLMDLMFADEKDTLEEMRALFLDALEAEDNGQELFPGGHVFSFADVMNLTWREDPGEGDARFIAAAETAQRVLERAVAACRDAAEGKARVREALKNAGATVILDGRYPWQDTVIAHNKAHPEDKKLFVVYPDGRGRWSLKTVPRERGGFTAEKDLPAAWAGLRDDALCAATGVSGAIFCHKARFLAVFDSREGAIAAAAKAEDGRGDGGRVES